MTEHSDSAFSEKLKSKKTGGGSAFGGGANFQSSLTAIVASHILHGSPLGWLDGVCIDIPSAVWAESEGAGDDLRIELTDGSAIEVQAKKGLKHRDKLWSALMDLAQAIHDGSLAYGILAVASDTSAVIREDLANDIERMGQGRADRLTAIGNEFHNLLLTNNLSVEIVCRSLQIRVIDTLISKNGDISAAKNVLRLICVDETDACAAFDILGYRALRLIENRGRWTLRDLVQLLRTRGIKLRNDGSPAALLDRYGQWVSNTHNDYAIIGAGPRIPIEYLLPMKLEHREFELAETADALSALQRYQKIHEREHRGDTFDSLWTARFRRKAVVVAGPGLGKSTMLRALAYQYSVDGFMVLSAPLKSIVAGIHAGKTFTESLVNTSFDGSGIPVGDAINDRRYNWVILLDALDECGKDHRLIAEHIRRFASGYPATRIVVTTRPIGYATNALKDWAHYTLLPPKAEDGAENVEKLLKLIAPQDLPSAALHLPTSYGRRNSASNGFAISPQLLGMSAVLILRKRALPTSRVKLYRELIRLFEGAENQPRASDGGELIDIAIQVLDLTGWHLIQNPLLPLDQLIAEVAADLAQLLERSLLLSKGFVRDALSHWERMGLVETFFHSDIRMIAFIHKSFCEFVAGRHLNQQTLQIIDQAADRQDMHEVVNFGLGLGLADKLIDICLARHAEGDASQLNRALALLSKPEVVVAEHRISRLIALSFKAMDDDDTHIFTIGVALSDIVGQPADLVIPEASKRLYVSSPAVRLVAWALFSRSMNDSVQGATLLQELSLTVPAPISGRLLQKPEQERHDLELLRRLASNCLKACPDSEARDFALTLPDQVFSNLGFIIYINEHLESRQIAPVPTAWDRSGSSTNSVSLPLIDPGFRDVGMSATLAVAKAFIPDDHRFEIISEGRHSLPQLAGFLRASGFMNSPASDVYSWGTPYEAASAKSTLRYIASLLPLDHASLQQECSKLLNLYLGGVSSISDVLPDVDIQELTPVDSARPPYDLVLVKQALLHPSEWLCRLAARICSSFPVTKSELEILLPASSGASLSAVLRLVAVHHPNQLTDMARRRLTGESTGDLSAAFHVLRSSNMQPCPEVIEIALSLLCSECKNTSASAAELLSCWLNQAVVIDTDKVDKAIEHWGGSQTAKPLWRLHTPLHSIIELSDKIRATNMAAEK
ncbi:hypothetical protein [Pseudomonas sp. PvP028]|uniref:NACHT domain-containing protein n=1 Tax=unclassified Pseudomonas TaxID=196821 RepID=UPI001AE884A9|nr:hypothetical protein [Pseudomonas sp. PvP028]MBP1122055.1 hypothetical protein [Pseudomonas sp. PvP028]